MAHTFKKQFGQNFLRGDRYAQALVDALDLQPEELVVEIGPGDGRVTNLLLQTGAHTTSVEVDYDLIPNLIKRFGDNPRFELLHQDIMQLDTNNLQLPDSKQFKMAGSLPYNISKPIIYKFLTAEHPPVKMSFIVQEEVAQDYVALAPQASFLSNWVRLWAKVKKLESIPASQFFPQPKVNGAILVITPYQLNAAGREAAIAIGKLMELAFRSPRKTLWNNLRAVNRWEDSQLTSAWQKLGWSPTIRPAQVPGEEWSILAESLQ